MGYAYFKSDIDRYFVLMPERTLGKTLRLWAYTPGLWILLFYRFGQSLSIACRKHRILKPLVAVYGFFYFLLRVFVGIDIPIEADIGEGFYIGHYGGIIIHPASVIGRNCNISQGVTIGAGGRGDQRGVPTIGDRVYIGPGAMIFGSITVGNNVAVGANAVVNSSVPDDAVVGGIPAQILSTAGSQNFIVVKETDNR